MNSPAIRLAEQLGGVFGFVAIFFVASTGQPAEIVLGVASGALLAWANFFLIKTLVIKFIDTAKTGKDKLGYWAAVFPLKLLVLAAAVGVVTQGLGASAAGLAMGVTSVVIGIMAAMFYAVLTGTRGSKDMMTATAEGAQAAQDAEGR